MSDIISTLEQLRDAQRNMVAHHSKSEEKRRQNEALVAAGLEPMHDLYALTWDRNQAAKYQQYVAALDAVIAELGSRDSGYLHLGKAGAAIAMALDAKAAADKSEAA